MGELAKCEHILWAIEWLANIAEADSTDPCVFEAYLSNFVRSLRHENKILLYHQNNKRFKIKLDAIVTDRFDEEFAVCHWLLF